MTTILIIAVAIYVLYIMIDKESMNPFTIAKAMAREAGVVAGATPRALHVAKTQAYALHKESKLELLQSGENNKLSFKEGRKEGKNWAEKEFRPYEETVKARLKLAEESLAIFDSKK